MRPRMPTATAAHSQPSEHLSCQRDRSMRTEIRFVSSNEFKLAEATAILAHVGFRSLRQI
jgi:hypothetical protein